MQTQTCTSCHIEKDIAAFPVDRRRTLPTYSTICLQCKYDKHRAYMRAYFERRWKEDASFREKHAKKSLESYYRRAARLRQSDNETSAVVIPAPHPKKDKDPSSPKALFPGFKFRGMREPLLNPDDATKCLAHRFQEYLNSNPKFCNPILANEYFYDPFDPRLPGADVKLAKLQERADARVKAHAQASTT